MPYSIIKLNPKTYQVVDKKNGKTTYLINKKNKTCFSVINTETGKVHAKCTSLQNAKAQLRLLYGVESGTFKPTKGLQRRPEVALETNGKPSTMKGKGDVETPMEEYENYEEYGDYGDGIYISTKTPVQRIPEVQDGGAIATPSPSTPPKETWKTFFARHAKGKKFASAEDSRLFMKKVGELWRNQKANKKMTKQVESEAKKSMKLKMKMKKGKA